MRQIHILPSGSKHSASASSISRQQDAYIRERQNGPKSDIIFYHMPTKSVITISEKMDDGMDRNPKGLLFHFNSHILTYFEVGLYEMTLIIELKKKKEKPKIIIDKHGRKIQITKTAIKILFSRLVAYLVYSSFEA